MSDALPASPDQAQVLALLGHPAIQKHLDILQGIINRLAQNSVTCKNWCITLVAGILVLAFSKDIQDGPKKVVPLIACIPILIFWLLDAYYHALEKCFRRQSQSLVNSVHDGTFTSNKVLVIGVTHNRSEAFNATMWVAFTSAAAAGFYASLVAAVIIVRLLVC